MSGPIEQLDVIEGERGIPNVNAQNTARWKRGAAGVVVCATLAAGALVAHLKFGNKSEADNAVDDQRATGRVSTVKPRKFVDAYEPVTAAALPVPVQPIVPIPKPSPRPLKPPKPLKPVRTLDKASSRSAVASSRVSASTATAQQNNQQGAQNNTNSSFFGSTANGANGANAQEVSDTGNLATLLKPTKLTATSASLLANRNLMIAAGAFIDCALSTRLVSTVPGMTSCVVTRDVFGDNGKLILIERGSLVTGEYRSNLRQGMSRIFVLWNRVKTPEGVVINLDSPATDSLGASGIAGHVDNHFWKRFGGAFLLSLVDDVARAATTSSNNNNENTQIVLSSAGSVSSDLAAEILRNTINIPPTLYANQGSRVGIFVARDLDFSNVYDAVPQ